MIHGWRITEPRFADPVERAFSGLGAAQWGGRWNHLGDRMVYTSASLALAVLEYFVNLESSEAPELVSVRYSIPFGVAIPRVDLSDLPSDWRMTPAPHSLRTLGRRWLREQWSVCLRVPSAVIPAEDNLLLNPHHPDFSQITFERPERFSLDPRLWKA